MANANRGRGQKKRANSGRTGYKGILFVGLGLAIISVVVFFILGGVVGGEKAKLEKYLNDKYGQEFVVENVSEVGVSLGGKGAWKADAYPKSDPLLRFEIRRSQTTGKVTKDTFLQTLWSKQGQDEVKKFMATTFPNHEGFFLTITPGNHSGVALYDSIQGVTPTLEDTLAKYKDEVAYTLSINDVTNVSPNEPSVTSLENAMKVVDFVKSQGAGIPSVNYGYRDASFTERTLSGQQKYQYRIKLEREALQKVNSSSDLKQYFEVIEY